MLEAFQTFAGRFTLKDVGKIPATYLSPKKVAISTRPPSAKKDQALFTPDEIKSIQKWLNQLGYDAGPVDGIWGRRTNTAIKKFRKSHSDIPESAKIERYVYGMLKITAKNSPTDDYRTWFSRDWNIKQVAAGERSLLESEDYPCHIRASGWKLMSTERRKSSDNPWYSFGDIWQKWAWKFVVHNPTKSQVIVKALVRLESTRNFDLDKDEFIGRIGPGDTGSQQGASWYNSSDAEGEGKPARLGYTFRCVSP
jgi:hypothetical protein